LLAVKTVAVTSEAHVNVSDDIPQLPLEDFNVNPEPVTPHQYDHVLYSLCYLPEAVAVYVAQVPVVYHVPADIRHPS
jgi:hypothetical protein